MDVYVLWADYDPDPLCIGRTKRACELEARRMEMDEGDYWIERWNLTEERVYASDAYRI